MSYSNNIVDLLLENMKKLFFPEELFEIDLKFSKSEIFTMLFLDKRKEITMTELVAYINTPMSTATGIVDRLVKNRYVQRNRSETDRRIVLLSLTTEGSQLIRRLKDLITGYFDLATQDLTEEEKQFLIRIVLKIINNLQAKVNNKAPEERDKDQIKEINIE